jgi:HAE1 family hydrophobic/amphiphilic exporter-1
VGVVIDDAIVVLENVFHFIEEKGMDPFTASIHGTREIGPAVLATTISLVIVFLPVSFLSSVTGRMLFQFGITATVAILVSMLVSFTLTPMMCSKLLSRGTVNPNGASSRQGWYGVMEAAYMWSLRLSMRFRWAVMLLSAATIATNWWLYDLVEQDYIPTNVDESEFEISITAPEGASLASMDEILQRLEGQIRDIPGIELLLTTIGTRGFGGVNRAEMYVRLQDIETRTFSLGRWWEGIRHGDTQAAFRGNFTQRDKMVEVRKLFKQYPDLRASVRNLTSLRQGAPVDVDFSVTGPDIAALQTFTEKLREAIDPNSPNCRLEGFVDVDTTLRMDKPELLVHIDRPRAAALGVDAREIAETLRVAVGGDDRVSRYRDATVDDAYDVELRLVGLDRRDIESISQLYVRTNPQRTRRSRDAENGDGRPQLTRIDNVVSFETGVAPARIDRLDRQRMVAVRANIASGYALANRLDALNALVSEIGKPPGFDTRVLGRGRELERTLKDFVWTFALSFVFMYIVLAAARGSIRAPGSPVHDSAFVAVGRAVRPH